MCRIIHTTINLRFLIYYVFFCFTQASDQRTDGPAESRSFAIVQHQAATHPRPDHTAPVDAFFAHIARIRQSRHSGRSHCYPGKSIKRVFN